MRGDFSRWRRERQQNFNGVLHQQGRVLLDGDWNAQTTITNDWQDIAGRDIIGAGVAAVPADEPDGFRIDAAAIVNVPGGEQVQLTVAPGRAWVDGLLVYLHGTPPVLRIATYLEPPVQNPAAEEGTINAGTRDAVVLEVWREEINGFQLPDVLLEPALGGPDTTERVHTAAALRLMRLTDGQTCENIIGELKDDFANKGRLTASLVEPVIVAGDCPVAEGGGYTGFEHNLYRIEIAQTDSGAVPMFKWSQFGGGLVGRGLFDAATKRLKITANAQAIVNSGLQEFYLEALEYDPALAAAPGLGHWRVTYGAEVTLGGDGQIVLPAAGLLGSIPSSTASVFFRLWNGIEEIADFTAAAPANPLQDGILLQFDAPATGNYVAGDYWTFDVRAGDLPNDEILIDDAPPEGIEYHRAPLAVLNWQASSGQLAPGQIEDCRHIFRPLMRLAACCTFRVGDGVHSHGDFLTIQEAIDKLPAAGGEVCVLPGLYTENVRVERRGHVTIKGCGVRSRIVAAEPKEGDALPAIHILDSEHIRIESLAIDAAEKGVGVLLEGPTPDELWSSPGKRLPLSEITLKDLHLSAATRSAVEAHVGQFVTIRECRVEMRDVPTDWPAIFFVGEDSLIEDNEIRVIPARVDAAGTHAAAGGAGIPGMVFDAEAGRGGLQLGATCDRVRVIDNLIEGGIGNGITLGSLQRIDSDGTVIVDYVPAPSSGTDNPCSPCGPGDTSVPPPSEIDDKTTIIAGGALYDILIEHNRIRRMGLNGISSVAFFNLAVMNELITVERLNIFSNEIRQCLLRPVAEISPAMLNHIGYGGIALADVEYLVIRDNFIEDNSPNPRSPVCGIFVLHVEGVEISRNRINGNGARLFKFDDASQAAKPGRRGGINIVHALAPTVAVEFKEQQWPMQEGMPAAKVHENIVSVPLGQALVLSALGPVSVVGNQFTSRGVVRGENSTGFFAATVLIRNLGLSNELYFQLLSFAAIQQAKISMPQAQLTDSPTAAAPGTGRNVQRLGRYLANGNVLFANNQCTLNLLERGESRAFSSVALFSLDDIGFHANQCDCDLLDDFVISQAIVFAISVRVSDNRFKEGIFNAALSAMTFGMMNTTTDNQATHCLLIRGWPQLVVSGPNIILQTLSSQELCDRFNVVQRDFGIERMGDGRGDEQSIPG